MSGFDMGINFDGFEENVKKFMELPIKYLDSAHGKAVEFIEDVHAMFRDPFPDDKVPNKDDQSSSNFTTELSPISLIGPNAEASIPASLVTVENSSTGYIDTGASDTESFSTKSTDSSEEVILWNPETSVKPPRPPELTIILQDDHAPNALKTEKVTEQGSLHCSGHSVSSIFNGAIALKNSSANYEEQLIVGNANDPVGATMHDAMTMFQDDLGHRALHTDEVTEQSGLHYSEPSDCLVELLVFYEAMKLENSSSSCDEQMVLYSANGPVAATTHDILIDAMTMFQDDLGRRALHMDEVAEQAGLHYSEHAGISISHDSNSDVSSCAGYSNMSNDDIRQFVDINLRDGQEHMKNDKIEAFPVPQRKNASFKQMFMRNLSSKLRWSKKQASMHQAMPSGSQDAGNFGYQMVSSSDGLEDDWEIL